ncbi:uncharacterized protein BT62DRAFT_1007627 [Guyanagaster necrorhizus]|uniref:Uncharacterized protein n=1 Tax=Guyanagaster necrorhizus TaxID=856835 RepID=A0A9P7VRI5_9AGAR|nr:uncharacterized protein BT62DRAFT_1007627 [Guyanagaster necrorhizus MCA 3950]KAG7444614.1 hypothetical protein BT62DRAFT_1007627 [Guyanagaster necrorhizus MCA 3950]
MTSGPIRWITTSAVTKMHETLLLYRAQRLPLNSFRLRTYSASSRDIYSKYSITPSSSGPTNLQRRRRSVLRLILVMRRSQGAILQRSQKCTRDSAPLDISFKCEFWAPIPEQLWLVNHSPRRRSLHTKADHQFLDLAIARIPIWKRSILSCSLFKESYLTAFSEVPRLMSVTTSFGLPGIKASSRSRTISMIVTANGSSFRDPSNSPSRRYITHLSDSYSVDVLRHRALPESPRAPPEERIRIITDFFTLPMQTETPDHNGPGAHRDIYIPSVST